MASNTLNGIVLASLFILIGESIFAQTWSYAFSYQEEGNQTTLGMGVEHTSSGYIVSELVLPLVNDLPNRQIRLLFLNNDGEETGYSIFSIPGGNLWGTLANNLHKTPWNTYLIAGVVSDVQTDFEETGRSFVIEFNEFGIILNEYIHETGYFNSSNACIALVDGSIIVGGHTSYAGNPLNNAWAAMLFKLNPNWELDWDQAYLQSQIRAYEIHSVTTDFSDNIFIGGRVYLLNTSGCEDIPNVDYEINPVLIKTDSNGAFQWKIEPGTCRWETPLFISNTNDGSIVAASMIQEEIEITEGFPTWDYRRLMKLDPNDGQIIWENRVTLLDAWDGSFRKALELANGNFITCGYDQAFGQGFRGEIALFSNVGDSLWMRPYMFDNDMQSWLEDVIPTSDGGFVACGRVFATPSSDERSWVIKMDEHGCLVPGCHLVGVEESKEEFPWSIGPNPTVDQLYVFIGANPGHNASLELYDLQGRWIKSVVLDPSKGVTYILDMGSLPIGQYILKLVTESGVWSEKVVKA